MKQSIGPASLVVREYDEAIALHASAIKLAAECFLFLYADDFWRDFRAYKARGVAFVREPKEEPYGTVAVFQDLYGNLWDLVQPKP